MIVSVGQACNLKCKDCGALAPYADKKRYTYNVQDIISDTNLYSQSVQEEYRLQIQGGEPLLYRDLVPLIVGLSKDEKIKKIIVATNGTIIPNEEIMKAFLKYDVELRVSDYNLENSKIEELRKLAEEFNVSIRIYKFKSRISKWYQKSVPGMQRENDDIIVQKRFTNCKNNTCYTIEDGRLSYCSRAMNASYVQGFENAPGDILDIRNAKNLRDEIQNYLDNKHFMEACRYCWGTCEEHLIDPAIQL